MEKLSSKGQGEEEVAGAVAVADRAGDVVEEE
jgi:hypothetical protein